MPPLLEVTGLGLRFYTNRGEVKLFDNLNLHVNESEFLGIVGESGCGKSTLAYAVVRLLPVNCKITAGDIRFDGESLLAKPEKEMRQLRGRGISMVFQDPSTSLNPVFKVADQFLKVIEQNLGLTSGLARQRAAELLKLVELPDHEAILESYPFELSGGMQQRVMIAMALSSNPKIIIADEPTSAVDATIQAQILELLRELRTQLRFSMILITHSIAVVSEVCDKIAVMYAGNIVEEGPASEVLASPKHPYTVGLLETIPKIRKRKEDRSELPVISGFIPDLTNPPSGCRFHPRCKFAMPICSKEVPQNKNIGGTRSTACFLY